MYIRIIYMYIHHALLGSSKCRASGTLTMLLRREYLYFCTSKASKLSTFESCQHTMAMRLVCSMRHDSSVTLSAYVSIRQHTSAYASICQHATAHVSIRQHTSEYASIHQHTSAYASIRHRVVCSMRHDSSVTLPLLHQYLYLCTSKASTQSNKVRRGSAHAVSASGVSICTFVPVKLEN
jgi:hypothetical protein